MANKSDLTRKEQVFAYLKARLNAWVDGPDIANEQIGGSEGLKRLRELRVDLESQGRYEIQMRKHPNPQLDIYQYRLTEVWPVEPIDAEHLPAARERPPEVPHAPPNPGKQRFGGGLAYDEATGQYVAVVSEETQAVLATKQAIADGQISMGVKVEDAARFTKMPEKLGLGSTVPCPRCHNVRRAIKEADPVTGKPRKDSRVLGYESFTRDPKKPSQECPRCNGFGVVPPT
ncbi:MAG TPA: hypothetical protein VFX15_03035 [Actinomycetes bacterium]|nr:hypothetical protein [Actinomycetes bacterium]